MVSSIDRLRFTSKDNLCCPSDSQPLSQSQELSSSSLFLLLIIFIGYFGTRARTLKHCDESTLLLFIKNNSAVMLTQFLQSYLDKLILSRITTTDRSTRRAQTSAKVTHWSRNFFQWGPHPHCLLEVPLNSLIGNERLACRFFGVIHDMIDPAVRLTSIGSRAFPAAGTRICNTLPLHVCTSASSLTAFKQRLKLHLFCFSFPGLSPVWLLSGPCSVCCHLGKLFFFDWLIDPGQDTTTRRANKKNIPLKFLADNSSNV